MAARADTYVLQCTFGFQNLPRRIEKTDPKSGHPDFKTPLENPGLNDFFENFMSKNRFLTLFCRFQKSDPLLETVSLLKWPLWNGALTLNCTKLIIFWKSDLVNFKNPPKPEIAEYRNFVFFWKTGVKSGVIFGGHFSCIEKEVIFGGIKVTHIAICTISRKTVKKHHF